MKLLGDARGVGEVHSVVADTQNLMHHCLIRPLWTRERWEGGRERKKRREREGEKKSEEEG